MKDPLIYTIHRSYSLAAGKKYEPAVADRSSHKTDPTGSVSGSSYKKVRRVSPVKQGEQVRTQDEGMDT